MTFTPWQLGIHQRRALNRRQRRHLCRTLGVGATAYRRIEDWSNYTGVPTPDELAAIKAGGVTGIILGTQNASVTRQQKAALDVAGVAVLALYIFVYWRSDDTGRLDGALSLAQEWSLKVWLDCEWVTTNNHLLGWADTPMPAPAVIVDMIHRYKLNLGLYYAGIYTGRWWWPQYTGDCTDFSDDPLWDANYTGQPDFDNWGPYSAWRRPTIEQYSSAGENGVIADLDAEEDDVNPPMFGWQQEGNQLVEYVMGVPVRKHGSEDGQFPGQEWVNEGGTWVLLRGASEAVTAGEARPAFFSQQAAPE